MNRSPKPDRPRGFNGPIVLSAALATVLLLHPISIRGLDWPQFQGPERNGSTAETIAVPQGTEPPVLWSRDLGAGFSGPIAVGDRVIVHHRRGDAEILECLDTRAKGATLWRHEYPTQYRDSMGFDEGPRATPASDGGYLFAHGAEGTLVCVHMADGKERWRVATAETLRADKGFFGFACSPLVHDGVVMLNVGGRDEAGIVGFDAATGKVRWKATQHEAGYASPVLGNWNGERRALFFTREGLVVVEPATGRIEVEFPWRSRQYASVNATAPHVLGDRVFLTASYDTGAILLDLRAAKPRKIWSNDESLSSHYSPVVHRDGFIFGFHGRQESGPSLRCIEAASGKVHWSMEGLGAGSLLLAGDQLIVLTERGELLMGTASPEKFQITTRCQILGSGGRSFPALAGGKFYARDPRKLVCVDLVPKKN